MNNVIDLAKERKRRIATSDWPWVFLDVPTINNMPLSAYMDTLIFLDQRRHLLDDRSKQQLDDRWRDIVNGKWPTK